MQPTHSSTLFPYTTLFRSSTRFETTRCSRSSSPSIAVLPPARSITASSGQSGCSRTSRNAAARSEEHTSELQSRRDLVCRLLLEKKNLTLTFRTPQAVEHG